MSKRNDGRDKRQIDLRDKALADMRREMSAGNWIKSHLAYHRSEDPEGAEVLEADLIEVFSSEKGLRVLKLLEKAVLLRSIPDGADDRALREANAVRNFNLEIRRIVANG